MKLKFVITVCALLNIVSLECFAAAEQIPADKIIKTIHAYDNLVFIEFSPSFATNQGCTATDGSIKVAIDTSNNLGKNLYSAALSAAAAKKNVGFGVSGCHSDRPKLYRIDVKY